MRTSPRLAVIVVVLATFFANNAHSGRSTEPSPAQSPGRPLAELLDPRGFATTAVETTLATFTFDNGSGGPDAQGWTAVDRTAQIGAFFHVDNFAGLGGAPWTPLSGTKSLWCGARPCASPTTDDLCSYATLPGYGNGWDQRFQSTSFSVTGDVSIAFDIRYDVEATYDAVNLEYSVSPGTWLPLTTFQGIGSQAVLETVPAIDHPGSIRFRFRVVSDGAFSDEDGLYPSNGAAVIDNVIISDASGVVDSQDFESEPVGILLTLDFDWFASTKGQYGIHAALFDGDAVLQEDPVVTNSTNFWGFFNNSTANYACGGHPEQAVVPYGKMVDGNMTYIRNEVRSPEIPYLGVAPGAPVRLDFDVYTNMWLDNLVFYEFRVRSKVGGVWKRWRSNGTVYYKPEKEWRLHSTVITSLVEAGATAIQVAVGAVDMCESWCGIFGNGACHSHGPLIDNVRVIVSHDAFVVTNTNDSGAGSLREAITQLNLSLYGGVIRFDIPGTAPFVIPLLTPLPTITKAVVIDGTSQPGYDGTPLVNVRGPILVPAPVLALSADNSRVHGLHVSRPASDPQAPGIALYSNSNVVQRCIISDCIVGIAISGSDNLVGGKGLGDGNTIFAHTGDGIQFTSAAPQRNSILGNSVYSVGGLGIDLFPDGITANDAGDGDTGANGLQNYPVLSAASAGPYSTTIDGTLSSTPNTMFRVEFFASDACNTSGYGNGRTFIGFNNLYTDGTGTAPINEYLAMGIPTGSVITATATDPAGNTSEFSACVPSINTATGSNVVAQPVDATTGGTPVAITFDQVTGGGNTSLVTGASGPALPGTFDIGDGVYYNLSTTATFTGDFELCISYNEGALLVPEANLRLLHWDALLLPGAWVDITTSLDVVNNMICGTTNRFSPFVLASATATGVGDHPLPQAFALRPNVPNPFNPTTTIFYDVPQGGTDVTISIYDVSGRLVKTLVDDRRPAGTHQVVWDGRNASGNPVSTGVYFYRMVAGSFTDARRMVLLK